jgi:hypothetical protein
MSLSHSPKIVTDGLVFYYDMANTKKSWKGAPTTNVSLINGQTGVNPWSGDGTPTILGIDPTVTFRGRSVAKFQTGTSGNCYLNGTGDLSPSTLSTVWTSTFYLKRVDGAAISSVSGYLYVTNNTNVNGACVLTQVEDGWYKAVYTRTGLVSGYPTLTGMFGLVSGVQYYFADWQCENNSISTPYVDGTRSNTQAIVDLTNNNTVTANSLTYNSDGSFSFNGSSNLITFPNNTALDTQTPTVEVWVKTNATTQNGFWFEKGTVNTQYALFQEGANIQWRLGPLGDLTTPTATYMNTTSWYQVVGTYTSGDRRLYINGVQVNSNATTGSLSVNSGGSSIGVYGGFSGGRGYYYNGNIGMVRVYNRALSAAEVLQNFNAQRSRYGL